MSLDTDVEEIAARQHGAFTDAQARAVGATEDACRHRRRTGRWIRHRRGVNRLVGAPLTDRLELVAAVLAMPGACVSHQSAAALVGLPGFVMVPISLTTTGARSRAGPGISLRRSGLVAGHHLRVVDGIPCTSVARTLFDLCGSVHPLRAERALDNALARRSVTVPSLQRVLCDLAEHGRAGTVVFRDLLEARGSAYVAPESELEARFVELARTYGLPEPLRQVDLGDVDGWIGRVDFLFRAARLVVEVDGHLAHSALLDRRHDAHRDHRMVGSGWTVVRLTWSDLTIRPGWVARRIREALRSGAAA